MTTTDTPRLATQADAARLIELHHRSVFHTDNEADKAMYAMQLAAHADGIEAHSLAYELIKLANSLACGLSLAGGGDLEHGPLTFLEGWADTPGATLFD